MGWGEQGLVACKGDGAPGGGQDDEFCLECVGSEGFGGDPRGIPCRNWAMLGVFQQWGSQEPPLLASLESAFQKPSVIAGGPSVVLESGVSRASLALVLSASCPEAGLTSAQGPTGSWPSAGSREERALDLESVT